MLIEKIPQDDLLKIDAWRRLYCYNEDANYTSSSFSPVEEILQVWEREKKDLFKLFGNELIIKKEFQYNKSKDELELEAYDMIYPTENNSVKEFMHQYKIFTEDAYFDYEIRYKLKTLTNISYLINNIYEGEPFEIELPNGKNYRVSKGAKISRILGKLASAFNLKGYEEFRIAHSQLLNQKRLNGTLTLSIHPLDYMTMSDNDCGWESCMSWVAEGDYRIGTTEMMNSPYVVVAYLTSDKEMTFHSSGREYTWNSKKWRQLFIVDKNIIMGIKGYPYYNTDLTKAVLEWIRELAKENLDIEYAEVRDEKDITKVSYEAPNDYREIWVRPNTYRMYNDFGSLYTVYLALKKGLTPEDLEKDQIYINYSGEAQCMVCGSVYMGGTGDNSLACSDCQELLYCSFCDETASELYEVDGEDLCSYCYEEHVHTCDVCEEEHLGGNLEKIYVIPRYTPEEREKLNAECPYHKEYINMGLVPYYLGSSGHGMFEVCNEEFGNCLDEFVDKFLVENGDIHQFEDRWHVLKTFVYFDELRPDLREEYCGYEDEDQYKASFYSYQIDFLRVIEEN